MKKLFYLKHIDDKRCTRCNVHLHIPSYSLHSVLDRVYRKGVNQKMADQPSNLRKSLLFCTAGVALICWGLLLSLQPAFYPTEAEKKGATPSQVKHFCKNECGRLRRG